MPIASAQNDPAVRHKQELNKDLSCPSAQPEWDGAKVFGVVQGSVDAPRVSYLARSIPISPELIELTRPATPGEVLRIAAPCATHRCQHFEQGHCQLVARTVEHLPTVTQHLPPCSIRTSCRWWHEQGSEACFRCPQVVTNTRSTDEKTILAATPAVRPNGQ